jgi:cardiolipin synthase
MTRVAGAIFDSYLIGVTSADSQPKWFVGGQEFYPAMLTAIASASRTIALEIYIFADDSTGQKFLSALTRAAARGVRVRLLVDDLGSLETPTSFFQPLSTAGGEVKIFNPLRFHRFGVRDHRKLLVCDGETVFIGGANIADAQDGDGMKRGWFDTVTSIQDTALAAVLVKEFDRLFTNAEFESAKRRRLRAFRPLRHEDDNTQHLPVKPGRGASSFQRALQNEIATAAEVDFITPYFLPGRRLLRTLREVVKRGGRVRLLLPSVSDVLIARLAAQIYYARLLRAGVKIYEYQPQVLHAKLYRVDGKIFIGSSNLDVRSLMLNYELMLGLNDNTSVETAKKIFEDALLNSRRVELKPFLNSLTFWQRWKNHWAHFLLARIDPLIALRHFH